jgi:hypothetical protein
MHTRKTLLLNPSAWDITLDGSGRIALTHGDKATAQNVANEARLFTNDAYFIQDKGIPHFVIDLGRRINSAVVRSYLRRAANQVPDVKEVLTVNIISIDTENRTLTGDIQFKTVEGEANGAIQTYF